MKRTLSAATLIVPYYRNLDMLAAQVRAWNAYEPGLAIVVVDDGSPEPAEPIVRANAGHGLRDRLQLYRIGVDIPWNRGGARNLGTTVAETDWIVHVDIDHELPAECVAALLSAEVDASRWYRFPRWRVGAADETRRKDALPPGERYGQIKPHIDSYLCTRALYWRAGGYNEDFSGCLGGGSPFLAELERVGPVDLLPEPIRLHVHTRDSIADASDCHLSRDPAEFTRRKRAMGGDYRGHDPLRFPWERVL